MIKHKTGIVLESVESNLFAYRRFFYELTLQGQCDIMDE